MDNKLAKAIEFIKLLRWQYPLPSKLDEIDKFVFECEKEAAQKNAHLTGGSRPANCDCDSWLVLGRHDDWCPSR